MWGLIKSLLVVGVLCASFLVAPVSFATSISPSVVDLSTLQGDTVNQIFYLFDEKNTPAQYTIELLNVDLGTNEDEMSFTPLSADLASMFDIGETVRFVQAKQVEPVNLTVNVPANIQSQTLVVGLKVTEVQGASSGINVQTGLISLIFITIGDNIDSSAQLLDFSSSKLVASQLPLTFRTTIRNSGQRILQPQGEITVRNMFGGLVSKYGVNEEKRRIPIGQERTYTNNWGDSVTGDGFISSLKNETKHFAIGFFKVELNLNPYAGGENITAVTNIFILPWRFLLVTTAVFALFYGVVRVLRNK